MRIVAFRPEYQITVDRAQNRIFYQNFSAMRAAASLPHYRHDWSAALAEVRPGFVILSDMQVVNAHGTALLCEFQAVEQLIVQRGVTLVAEVHVPGLPTRRYSDAVTTSQAMPVEYFLDIWDATQFLDELQLRTDTAA
ncbi:hypothetical protein [Hymenobacter ruricola]|uniref:Uncharacterized protein n=1 Tax=Hymenobacter ruricola TaxID=2791023 RepID=A0ABS0HZH7_9BACT|nr:hypothetical protein [Hymenobacter ruricola]MBF9219752.1 hypothetical protein [Hymenobacter ruricola]